MTISNCPAAVLGLVNPGYFISPVLYPPSGETPYGRLATSHGRGENTKINYGMDTSGQKEKRASKKNVYGRSTSSHGNKKFGTRSMEKRRGMAFGFRKTATAVIKPDR